MVSKTETVYQIVFLLGEKLPVKCGVVCKTEPNLSNSQTQRTRPGNATDHSPSSPQYKQTVQTGNTPHHHRTFPLLQTYPSPYHPPPSFSSVQLSFLLSFLFSRLLLFRPVAAHQNICTSKYATRLEKNVLYFGAWEVVEIGLTVR